MSALTREQFEKLMERIDYCIDGYYRGGEGGIGPVFEQILTHDAAQRARIEMLESEAGYYNANDAMKVLTEQRNIAVKQLAASEQRGDMLARELASLKAGVGWPHTGGQP